MNKLKFRVWDKRKDKGSATKTMLYDAQKCGLWHDFIDYPETYELMQFTGLTDKNNKEIYEGDILKVWMERDLQDGFHIVRDSRELYFDFNRDDAYYRITSCEIMSNIFENPDLM